jgi:hypothetical protein
MRITNDKTHRIEWQEANLQTGQEAMEESIKALRSKLMRKQTYGLK